LTPDAPSNTTRSSKRNIPMIKMTADTANVKMNECITALFASSILIAPTYLEINEFAPAPTPLPKPIITRYNGEMNPSAARASALMPETQKLSIKLFKNIKSIEIIVGMAKAFMAFRGFPVIKLMLSWFAIKDIF